MHISNSFNLRDLFYLTFYLIFKKTVEKRNLDLPETQVEIVRNDYDVVKLFRKIMIYDKT